MLRHVFLSLAVVAALALTGISRVEAGHCYRGGGYGHYGGYPAYRNSFYYGGGYGSYHRRSYYRGGHYQGHRGYYGHPGYYGRGSGVSFSIGF